ncbi:MAG: type III secretion system translocon subunit SctE [Deltaproteobacteria bacterium]|nr:type III secretion system translocon subunit SctE [Deltaproteobacteria bacterium]
MSITGAIQQQMQSLQSLYAASIERSQGTLPMGESLPSVLLPEAQPHSATPQEIREAMASARQHIPTDSAMFANDPAAVLLVVTSLLGQTDQSAQRGEVTTRQTERAAHLQAQVQAAQQAAEAEGGTTFWSMFAKIAGYVGAAIGVIAGVAAAIATAGAAAPLIAAVAGAVAGAASLTQQALTDSGALAGDAMRGASIAVSVFSMIAAITGLIANPVGALSIIGQSTTIAAQAGQVSCDIAQAAGAEVPPAVRMALTCASVTGSGLAVGGAASQAGRAMQGTRSAAQTVARGIELGARVGQGAATVAQGAGQVGVAGWTFAAENSRADAQSAGTAARRAMEQVSELVNELREASESVQRSINRVSDTSVEYSRAQGALSRNLLRA